MPRRLTANPPRIRELMDDEAFKSYMLRVPATTTTVRNAERPHPGLTTGYPWQLWVRMADNRWKTAKYETYHDAWALFRKLFRRDDVDDLALVSRRVFFPPPGEWRKVKVRRANPVKVGQKQTFTVSIEERYRPTFAWDDVYFDWCARCRRPSVFRPLLPTHHALRGQPCITDDQPERCVYCGIRKVAMPSDPYRLAA